MNATVAVARQEVLDEIADDILDERAVVEARRLAREEAEQAATKRHAEQQAELGELGEKRRAALVEAEAACRAMCTALTQLLALGDDMTKLHAALGSEMPSGLTRPSALRHLSGCISTALRAVTGHASRFGDLALATTWRRPEQPWVESAPDVKRHANMEREDA